VRGRSVDDLKYVKGKPCMKNRPGWPDEAKPGDPGRGSWAKPTGGKRGALIWV